MDRGNMLKGRRENRMAPDRFRWSMITRYFNQHFSIKKIFKKHWSVLQNDRVLGPVIPEKTVIIFRGAPSLRHNIAPDVIDPLKMLSFFQSMKGFFPCRRCSICQINAFKGRKCETFQSTVTNNIDDIESFITCTTKFVVYIIQSPCSNNI